MVISGVIHFNNRFEEEIHEGKLWKCNNCCTYFDTDRSVKYQSLKLANFVLKISLGHKMAE